MANSLALSRAIEDEWFVIANHHTAAAATIRAAMAEIERLREALFRAVQKNEHCDDIECVDTFSEVCHCRAAYDAALAAQEKEQTDD